YTRVQTPRFCGFCSIAGTLLFAFCKVRPLRTSWLIVGIEYLHLICRPSPRARGPTFPDGNGIWRRMRKGEGAEGHAPHTRKPESNCTSLKRSTQAARAPGYFDGRPARACAPTEKGLGAIAKASGT